ncbi:hypothetical protein KKB44_02270 [Candidatus Micrarchaeota archaeon]|nr:hypothetical protein [Candidatus Micrarchaeota archaeon]
MHKKIIIAPINSESEMSTLFLPVREFPTERMVLLTSSDGIVKAEEFVTELNKWSIPASVIQIKPGNMWENFFTAIVDLMEGQEKDSIIINISTADRISQCALTNAAHVNGLKAIAIIDNKIMMLPILKLSYSSILSQKKMKILHELEKAGCSGSLDELAKKTNMSLQLLSYHIHGTPKSQGLSQLELVDIEDHKGKIRVCLSTMGRLFMRGHLKQF